MWYLGKYDAASPNLPPLDADIVNRKVVWPASSFRRRGRGLGGAWLTKQGEVRLLAIAAVVGSVALAGAFVAMAANAGVATVRYDEPSPAIGVVEEICDVRDVSPDRDDMLVVYIDMDGDGVDDVKRKFTPRGHYIDFNPDREC